MTAHAGHEPPPADLGPAGREWWTAVHDGFDGFDPADAVVIAEIGRTVDLLDRLRKDVAETGILVQGSKGQPVAHPALAAINAAQRSLGALVRQLDLGGDDDDEPARRPHPATSARARAAAASRWRAS